MKLPEGYPAPGEYGTIIVDPPWNYDHSTKDEKLRGYSTDKHYGGLTTADLCNLDVGGLARPDAVIFLWTTYPFLPDALRVLDAWGFRYVTGLPWVKADAARWTVRYGVGYWFRHCTEHVLVGTKPKARAVRTNLLGLMGPGLAHSRKPRSLYEVATIVQPEKKLTDKDGQVIGSRPEVVFPRERLEIFARDYRRDVAEDPEETGGARRANQLAQADALERERAEGGWWLLGNEVETDRLDIRERIGRG